MGKIRDGSAVKPRKRRTQWELFVDRHKPKKNHLEPNAPEDGYMFETFGAEYAFVRTHECYSVFTLVEGENGEWYVCSGFHWVNRIGYFVVEVPWNEQNEQKVYKA